MRRPAYIPRPVPSMLTTNAVIIPTGAPSHQPIAPPTLAPSSVRSLDMLGASRKASEQGEERRSWTACCGEQPVNVRCERKAESPERDRPRGMQRRCTRRGTPLMFVSNLYRGHDGTGHPRGQPPQAHVMGVGEHTEGDADDDIRHGNKHHRTDPRAG